jgi:antitoxin component YwqK of YwqJK toxin-antitoxin module
LEGNCTWYFKNGRKESEVTFIDGKKEGEQLFWSPTTEKIVKREFYKNGELVRE